MMKALEEGERWLAQTEAERFYTVCFLAQQSAEKAIKAYLYDRGKECIVGYAVTKLLNKAGAVCVRSGNCLVGEFGYSQD